MSLKTIYYLNPKRPSRPLVKIEHCAIKICEVYTWAILPDGTRTILGVGAFFTLQSAQRAQLGALRKLVRESGTWLRNNYPGSYNRANRMINELQKVLH